ncbi:MAG: serine/threonine-protein kinase, partial [Acidobacteriota bacterium]
MNTQQRWRQVDQIFSASLELDPAQRPAFLNESCGEDTALRRDVEELLAVDESSRPALDAVTWGAPAVSAAGPSAGTQLGLYELIEPLGEGGMGRVYCARRVDGQYEREVAIKVLKNSLLRRETLGRFRNECRLLAQLEHDGIARLYDAGSTPEGLPYLVMELVTGTRLDDFARQPGRSLRQRLELFRAICRAVSHAHQHLIVHRDLKPGNILVTEDLRPKLLDFG